MSSSGRNIKADVVIIGGGIVGCCAAIELRKRKYDVLIVEKKQFNYGASGSNAGGLYFQLQNQAGNFNSEQQAELKKSLGLILNSRDAWIELDQYLNGKTGLSLQGGFILAFDEEQAESLQRKNRLEKEWGINTQLLDTKEILTTIPFISEKVKSGTFHPGEGFVNPQMTGNAIKQKLLDLKVNIIEECEITSINFNNTFKLQSANNTCIEAKYLVNASGAWTNHIFKLLQLPPVCKMLPLQLHITEPCTSINLPYFLQIANRKLSLKQMKSGNIIIGGGWSAIGNQENPFYAVNDELQASRASLEQNLTNALTLLPSLNNLKLEGIKTGYAAWTLDGIPVVGNMKNFSELYTTLGGNGYTYGPLYGKLLAQLIAGENTSINIDDLNPNRLLNKQHLSEDHQNNYNPSTLHNTPVGTLEEIISTIKKADNDDCFSTAQESSTDILPPS